MWWLNTLLIFLPKVFSLTDKSEVLFSLKTLDFDFLRISKMNAGNWLLQPILLANQWP